MKINLSKEELIQTVSINLSKRGFDTSKLSAKVAFALDESGSMSREYQSGAVQAVLDRLLAVSYFFDDDGSIDMFAFGSGVRQLEEATQDDFGSYSFSPQWSGTNYSPVLRDIQEFYYGEGEDKVVQEEVREKVGKIASFFGKKGKVTQEAVIEKGVAEGRGCENDEHPVYVFFLTDGETASATTVKETFDNLMSQHKDLYVQFIGLGNESFRTVNEMVAQHPTQSSLIRIEDINTDGDDLLEKLITTDVKAIIQSK